MQVNCGPTLLCLLLSLKCVASHEIPQKMIDSRRLEILRFKLSQWQPFLEALNASIEAASSVHPRCRAHALGMVKAMLSRDPSGLKVLDSLGSLPTAIMGGARMEYGSHELCFAADIRDEAGGEIKTRFCHLSLFPKSDVPEPPVAPRMKEGVRRFVYNSASVKMDACLPASCTDSDVRTILDDGLKEWQLSPSVSMCDDNEPVNKPFLVMCVLGAFAVIVGLATLLDLLDRTVTTITNKPLFLASSGGCPGTLKALSAIPSFSAIFSIPQKSGSTDVFNGLRALATIWVIVIHTHSYQDTYLFDSIDTLYRMSGTLMRQLIVNASMCTCMFFTIGGFMLWQSLSKRWDKDPGMISFINLACHRYLRLFPMLLMTHLFHQVVTVHGHGPYWNFINKRRANAFLTNWPYYVFGVLNFLRSGEVVSPQHWYSGADFQLYLFSIFFVIWLKRSGKTVPLMLLTLVAMVTVYLHTKLMKLNVGLLFLVPLAPDDVGGDTAGTYYMPYNHFASYCFGILTGYYSSQYGNRYISKGTQVVLWIASVFGMSVALFGSILWTSADVPGIEANAMYAATHRALFSAGFSWLVFACVTGRGGFVNSVLSSPLWAPLSRLSFGAYMIFDFIIVYQRLSFRNRVSEGYYFMMALSIGNCFYSFVAAFLLHVVFEKPMNMLIDAVGTMLRQCSTPRSRHDAVTNAESERATKTHKNDLKQS